MFTWLKNLFSGTSVPEVINEVTKEEPKAEPAKPAAKPKTTKKKTTKKSVETVTIDLTKQTKAELLAHAKAVGVKANASMKKADIIAAIKND
jgi:hypothetical protein